MDYIARQQKLQQKLRQSNIDGFLVTQNVDLFYYTGSVQSGYLFIPAEGEARFYVRRSVVRAQEESASSAVPLGSFRHFGETVAADYPAIFHAADERAESPLCLATEFDVLPVQIFERLKRAFPHVDWVDGSKLIREARMIKSNEEIEKIKVAAQAVNHAFEHAISRLQAGMSELELIAMIEYSLRLQGHHGMMRMRGYNSEIITGMVASGAEAAVPTYFDGPAGGLGLSAASPQGSSKAMITAHEPILIDIGCHIGGYVIDQTRTAVIGQMEPDLAAAYALAERVLQQTEANLKPGYSCEQLYFDALKLVEEAGLEQHFMGFADDQVKFLGHGIGLEIDEFPVLAKGFSYLLEPGMVIAIEPKFTFPGRGVVGIENTYAITETGYEKLTITREGIITL